VDLLVYTTLSGIKFYGLVEELREKLQKKVDVLNQKQIANNFDLANEILKDGIKIYGATSFDNQMAVLSQFLHSSYCNVTNEHKAEIISAIRDFLSNKQVAQGLDEDDLSDEDVWRVAENATQYDLFAEFFNVPFPAPKNPRFTFIDLFAGIGGFRIAMQNLGGKCVYSSEFDAKAQESYLANYGEMPFGDITKDSTKSYIPKEFDVLCGGFPCQAFSLAGRRLGFKDETRGTLFFEIEAILKRHQPKAFFLENVKGLVSHDKGRTLETILKHLNDAGSPFGPLLMHCAHPRQPEIGFTPSQMISVSTPAAFSSFSTSVRAVYVHPSL
jgi:DNA (cytosine-5)-methyltransferase 1